LTDIDASFGESAAGSGPQALASAQETTSRVAARQTSRRFIGPTAWSPAWSDASFATGPRVHLVGPTFLSIELDGATLDAIVDPTRR
jgi:hypothetical protein